MEDTEWYPSPGVTGHSQAEPAWGPRSCQGNGGALMGCSDTGPGHPESRHQQYLGTVSRGSPPSQQTTTHWVPTNLPRIMGPFPSSHFPSHWGGG